MALCDIWGKPLNLGGVSGIVNPKDCSFFDGVYPTFSNLCNPEKFVYGYLNGATFDESSKTWITTDYIDIEGGAYLYAERLTSAGAVEMYVNRISFYDFDKVYISGASVQEAAIEIPDKAKYVRCCWNYSSCGVQTYPYNMRFHFVGTADDNTAAYLPFEYYYADKAAYIRAELKADHIPLMQYSPHRGRHLVAFGDSLTDSYGGHDLNKIPYNGDFSEDDMPLVKICHEFGMTLDNRANSGSNLTTHATTGYTDVNGCAMLDAYVAEVNAGTAQAPDYLLIAFGTNEYEQYAGTADNTSAETDYFSGAMKYFIETIRANFPGCVFGFVLPPQCDWSVSDNTYKNPSKARAVALEVLAQDEYAVPYIDMWTQSGITAAMASDGVHVNKEGAGKILYYHALRRFVMGL